MQASDIMTPRVVTIRADATVDEAIHLMLKNHISGLLVVDPAGDLVGIVTEGDFLRRAEMGTEKIRPRWLEFVLGPGRLAAEYTHTHGLKIQEVMTDDVITVTEQTPVAKIVSLMEKHRIKRLPVVRDDRPVGIVSRANLLQILARIAAEAKPVTKGDSDIRETIWAELAKQPWSPAAGVNVIVRDGIVELKGAIFDERARPAFKVAAENVPGVKGVVDHLIWVEPLSGNTLAPPVEEPATRPR